MGKIRGFSRNSKGYWMYQPSGKGLGKRPKAISLGTKDEDEALAKLIAARGVDFQRDRRGLGDWIDSYLVERRDGGHYRPRTLDGVSHSLSLLLSFFGNRDPVLIDRGDALDWFETLTAGRSLATAHRDIRYARAFFSWLIDRKAITLNPFSRLHLPTPSQSRRDQFCSEEERDRIIDLCARDDLRFVLHAGFFLGMRIGEITAAKWGWFHERGFATVRNDATFTTKTGKERQVPFNRRFATYWGTLEKGDPAAYVLRDDLGPQPDRYLRWDPRRPWKELVALAGLDSVTFHTMRHTFGSLHAIAGTPELKIRRWMGITPQTFERHYAGLCVTDPDADRI